MSTKSNIVRIEIPTSSSIFIRSNTNRETVVTIQHDNEENNVVIIASPERHENRIGEFNTQSCQNPMSSDNVSGEEIEGQSKNLEPMERMSSEEIEGQSKNLQPMERMSSEEIEGLSKNLQPMGRMSSEEIEGLSKNLELMESNRTELRKTGKKIVVTDKRVTRSAARIIGKISSNMVLRSGTKLSKCDQYKVRNGLRKHASKEILRTNRNVGKENTPLVTKEREDKLNTTNSRNIDGEIKENKLRKLPIRPGTRVIITRAMARIITRRQARSKVSEIIGKRKVACKMKRKLGHRTKPARNTKKNIASAEPTRNTKTNIVNDNAANLRTKRIVKPINLEDFVYTYTKPNRVTRKHTPADPIRQITKRHDQSPRKFLKLKSSGKIVKKLEGNNRNYILFTGRKIFVDNINIIKRMNWNCRIVLKPIRFQATTNKHLNYRSEIIEQMYHDKFDQNRHENELHRANSFHTYAKKLVTVLSCMQPNESIFSQPENYESIERNLEVTPDIKQNEHDEKLAKENLDTLVNNAESSSASTKHGAELGIITRSRLGSDKETESSTQYNIYRDNSSQFQVEQSGRTSKENNEEHSGGLKQSITITKISTRSSSQKDKTVQTRQLYPIGTRSIHSPNPSHRYNTRKRVNSNKHQPPYHTRKSGIHNLKFCESSPKFQSDRNSSSTLPTNPELQCTVREDLEYARKVRAVRYLHLVPKQLVEATDVKTKDDPVIESIPHTKKSKLYRLPLHLLLELETLNLSQKTRNKNTLGVPSSKMVVLRTSRINHLQSACISRRVSPRLTRTHLKPHSAYILSLTP